MNNNKSNRTVQVTIIGDSSTNEKNLKIAYKIGIEIAKKKWTLICGGKTGIMEAACKGAIENGGMTVGIVPETDFNVANKYCKVVIPTGMGYARNSLVALSGDVIVMIGGKTGTLNECSFAWFSNKPIIALTSVEGWSSKVAGQFLDDRRENPILSAETAEDVINLIESII